jgi:hypothetical protein
MEKNEKVTPYGLWQQRLLKEARDSLSLDGQTFPLFGDVEDTEVTKDDEE